MLDLIKYIVNSFAEHTDKIEYIVNETENAVDVTVVLEESDMGKVIGKQGRIAKAIRTVVKAAAVKQDEKVVVEIMQ